MMENDDQTGYKWETAYTEGLNIHAVLQEDETGSIEASVRKIVQEAKQKRRNVEKHSHVRLGIVSFYFIRVNAGIFFRCRKFFTKPTFWMF